jgi:anaerobic magnesium-protoporphyrin IX monomethyl ester cyclase
MNNPILLINAPASASVYGALHTLSAIEPPVWAGLIAQYLAQYTRFPVRILDAEADGLSIQETADAIVAAEPLLAVFCIYGHQPSASTQCLPAANAVAALLPSNLISIAVGTHPSALPEKTLLECAFTYVCQGEGPLTIAGLAGALDSQPMDIPRVPGLWLRVGPCATNQVRATNIKADALDDQLPGQAWYLLDMKRYRAHNWHLWSGHADGGYASVQTSLGCSFRCHFCCINAPFGNSSIRFWSPQYAIDQITHLVRVYGITNIKIPDEMFCLNPKHVKAICQGLIDSGVAPRLNMWAYARIDTVNDEVMLTLMRAAGFRWLGIGIESASEHVRNGVEKGRFGNQAIADAVGRVHAAGIYVAANYIFGLPDDTIESMTATLDLACELNTEMANMYVGMAYPGSELHRIAQREGWALPESPGGPGWIGYSQHAYESLPLRTKTLTAEQVLDFRDRAWMAYFTRESYRKMMLARFGAAVLDEIDRMTAHGMPARKHRGALE